MPKKNILSILCLIAFPMVLMAQTGKIAGKATDLETREPLIGASVRIVGSTLGASTDINGNYVILNVPIGSLTLECTYIGYQKITISNVRVQSNQTSERNFQLPSDAYKAEVVEIVAPRLLVNKNETNVQTTKTQDEIENLPVRGVEGIVALQANVVEQGGTIYVRGSRSDQVSYRLDGVNTTDPLFGGRAGSVINNAIEEINMQAGGYSAEFGGANGGMISTSTRTGGRSLQIAGEFITDSWNKPGKEALGGFNYGFSQYVLTAGGPIVGPLKFFVAGQNTFNRTPIRFFDGYDMTKYYASNNPDVRNSAAFVKLPDYKKYVLDANGKPTNVIKPGIFDPQLDTAATLIPIEYGPGMILNNASQSNVVQGNLTADLNRINLRLSGSYGYSQSRGGIGIGNVNNQSRASKSESENLTTNFKLTHMLTDKTFYELNVNYFSNFGVSYDPDLQSDVALYGDSIANAKFGYKLKADGTQPLTQNAYGFTFNQFGALLTNYSKTSYRSIGGKLGVVHQIGRVHEIKFGGEATTYTVRQYAQGAFAIKNFVRQNPTATEGLISKNVGTNNYGYDFWGNKLDSGLEGPKKPLFAAVYFLDKIELEDLVLNVGLRYDFIDTDSKVFQDPNNIKYDGQTGLIAQSNFIDADPSETVSPRIGFSFPVTDATVFYAQYGKFVSQSRLRDVYQGLASMSFNIAGGLAISNPVGFGLRPERTTQYDIGFRQQIGENFAFDLSAFYKDIRGQIQIRQIPAAQGAQHQAYYAWVNGDFATTVGASLKLNLRRVERVQASLDYTYSDSRGTGSSPSTAFRSIWQAPGGVPYFPSYATALDFDQTHRGAVNVDYRFGTDDGPKMGSIYPLERVGLNLLLTFNSGRPFTRYDDRSYGNARIPIEELNGSRTPWIFQVDARLDKSVKVGSLDLNFYLWVINLLNTKNVSNVFNQSGSASDDGWLGTEDGRKRTDSYATYGDVFGQMYQEMYRQLNIVNANFYGPPRQIRLGFRFNF